MMGKDPSGDDYSGGWDAGRSAALGRQEGAEGSADHGDYDDECRQRDVKEMNAWIKGGRTTDTDI